MASQPEQPLPINPSELQGFVELAVELSGRPASAEEPMESRYVGQIVTGEVVSVDPGRKIAIIAPTEHSLVSAAGEETPVEPLSTVVVLYEQAFDLSQVDPV